jgi:hypothetical protein
MGADNLDVVFKKFFKERTVNLFERFNGLYRSLVEETNDPLRIGRVRVRIPELHNKDVKVADLPWAVPSFAVGGKGCGWWSNPVIGDIVWVQFEKNHPYAPIWTGAATPTRRKFYPLPSINGKTPLSVNDQGQPADTPDDFLPEYLPADQRPMTYGMKDRYGTYFEFSAVGFFPKEHKSPPPPAGTDGIAKSAFDSAQTPPKANEPDVKYAVLNTKYGHTMIFNDVGYDWQKEFDGDFDKDESFEIDRQKYMTAFLNEGAPSGRDQRRVEFRSRYGHKFEMRDVGWKKSRPGEFDKQVTLSESSSDERWMKLRTKDGMLVELMDHGSDPDKDEFIKRLLKTEVGSSADAEDSGDFKEDARQIRLVTRHGHKFVLDDRGSDKTQADVKEEPRGNGILLKTRRGFGVDINDKEPSNRMMLYTPKSKVLDLNDRFDYIMMATDTSGPIPEKFKGTKGNEFATTNALTHNPEADTFYMKLDKQNKYVAVKTPEGQGLESRDKQDSPSTESSQSNSKCPSFTQLKGPENRGFWMSRDKDLAVWRSKNNQMYIALDDGQQLILIRNNDKKIQIVAEGEIELISNTAINMKAPDISIKADNEICMEAAGTHWVVRGGEVGTNAEIKGQRLNVVTMYGTHEVIQIPCEPCGPAPAGSATSCEATDPTEMDVPTRMPDPRPDGENCAPNQKQSPPVPGGAMTGGSGGFGIGPNGDVTVLPPQNPQDPLSPSGGVLWYGTVDHFETEATAVGLTLSSLINNLNTPGVTNANKFVLGMTMEVALTFAQGAQKNYGGKTLLMRVTSVPNQGKLQYRPETQTADYFGDIPASSIEIYSVGSTPFAGTPLYNI